MGLWGECDIQTPLQAVALYALLPALRITADVSASTSAFAALVDHHCTLGRTDYSNQLPLGELLSAGDAFAFRYVTPVGQLYRPGLPGCGRINGAPLDCLWICLRHYGEPCYSGALRHGFRL